MLTKQQKKLLMFIKEFQDENGISPSFDEMREALHQKSKSSIHVLISGLVERGFIRKLHKRARAIEIIKLMAPSSSMTPVLYAGEALPQLSLLKDPLSRTAHPLLVDIPSYGQQSTVFSAKVFLENPEKFISCPKEWLSSGHIQDHCFLQVGGEALKDMSILDGDLLLFKTSNEIPSERVVLALVDGEHLHMKKCHRQEDGKIVLSLGNKYMIPQVYEPERVSVRWVMVGLLRAYDGSFRPL